MIFFLFIALLFISYVDIKTKVIKDGITLFGILIALNWHLFIGNITVAVLGMTAGVGIAWGMELFKLNRLGGGDVKLLALIGACMGWQVAVSTAITAFIIFLPVKYRSKQKKVAYAPFITMSFVLVNLWLIVTSFLRI